MGVMAKHSYASGEWGGSYEANVYSNPDSCGLKIVATVEKEPDWDFDIVVLFMDKKTGSLWIRRDSGCSCPTPFEDVRSFADMTPVRSERGIDRFLKDEQLIGENYYSYRLEDVNDFRRKARAAVCTWKKSKEVS